MSLRIDPRRLQALKQLAAEEGVRPGDLVRQWVEERIDATRGGAVAGAGPAGGAALLPLIQALEARVTALESGSTPASATAVAVPVEGGDEPAGEAEAAGASETAQTAEEATPSPVRRRRNAVTAAPSGERVALHDEMIAVLRERGPLTAGELAGAIAERGRYAPPRSGKPLDAAMVSQRVSNPTYRSRFTRNEGRIGLAE
jgi:hypothetical protein